MIEFHRENAAPLRYGTEFRCVTKHLGQGDKRSRGLRVALVHIDSENGCPASVELAQHVAQVFFRNNHFHFHDWFEQHRGPLLCAFFECKDGGHPECHFVRVDFVERSVGQCNFEIGQRVSCQHAAFGCFEYAPLNCRDVFARDCAAGDLILELDAAAAI